jgi:hypothetical protein
MGTARFKGGKKYYTFNGVRGVPDILCILPNGQFCGIEAKRPGNINGQSDEQKYFEQEVNRNKGIYILTDSWELVEKKFKELGIVK